MTFVEKSNFIIRSIPKIDAMGNKKNEWGKENYIHCCTVKGRIRVA
jgi:hypothetical protein